VRKLKGRAFKGASRRPLKSLRYSVTYCVTYQCPNEGTFAVHLRLPERKVGE